MRLSSTTRAGSSKPGTTPPRAQGFAFDNESPRHKVYLEPFRLADRLVTAGEWLEFMPTTATGVRSSGSPTAGTPCRSTVGTRRSTGGDDGPDGWSVFTLNGRRPVEPDEPVVHVSHYEADAFARWSGARLPDRVRVGARDRAALRRARARRTVRLGAAARALHPAAAPAAGDGLRPGVRRRVAVDGERLPPLPAIPPAAGAVGEYNGKFMSSQMVLRGSACITPAGHARPTYRNFFPPVSRWMFAGLRLAADA